MHDGKHHGDHSDNADLSAEQSSKKIMEIATAARVCMFSTNVGEFPPHTCPMSLQDIDEHGVLYFLSAIESGKNADLARDGRVTLSFQHDGKQQFLSLAGHATVHHDAPTISAHWTPLANAWFDGQDDPRVTVIAVTPTSGHYWDSESGKWMAMAKMSFAALTGSPVETMGAQGSLRL
jgi:general stress protein 26